METIGDKAAIISRTLSDLLSTRYHYGQLLDSDERRPVELLEMLAYANIITAAAADIEKEIDFLIRTQSN